MSSYWWEDHDNIVLVAEWMADEEDGGPCDVRDLVHFITKPWQYDEQYELALKAYERQEAEDAERARRQAPRVAF